MKWVRVAANRLDYMDGDTLVSTVATRWREKTDRDGRLTGKMRKVYFVQFPDGREMSSSKVITILEFAETGGKKRMKESELSVLPGGSPADQAEEAVHPPDRVSEL